MKGKKKGVSSILGALIFLQILIISLLLVIHVTNNETNITLKSVQRFQALSENAPIEEEVENNITYLYSTTPFVITHVIYPNGEIINTSIVVNNKYPISQILNSYPWAIIVTSKGTWYNVTPLEDDGLHHHIIFPGYHGYGMPLDPSVLNVTEFPNWNVLEGITSPSTFSLALVNVTIGDPTMYEWGLTDAVLVVYPLSSEGWINITYYQPIHYTEVSSSVQTGIFEKAYTICNLINATLGIYVPINVTSTYIYNVTNIVTNIRTITENLSILEYTYIYATDDQYVETESNVGVPGYGSWIVNSWFTEQIGTDDLLIPYSSGNVIYPDWEVFYSGNIFTPSTVYFFPSYGLSNEPAPDFSSYYSPRIGVYSSYELPSNAVNLPSVNFYPTSLIWNNTPYMLSNSIGYPPAYYSHYPLNITVYQVDINLHKGEVLNYGYYIYNNSWILLFNWTFNYNNPEMYSEAYSASSGEDPIYTYAIPNGHGGFTFVSSLPPWYTGLVYLTNIDLTNIYNIQYPTNLPVYIAIPQGVYVLQVSLS